MKFKLSPESIRRLCYQRSDYCDFLGEQYLADMMKEFHTIGPYLPHPLLSILDIGCGLAGIDAVIARHYPHVAITLLDKDGFENKSKVGFQDVDSFGAYNSMCDAYDIMAQNGITKVRYCDIAKEPFPRGKYDLILSMFSWCFHYPFDTYAANVLDNLAPGGVVIVDVRKGHDIPWKGTVIKEGKKHRRMLIQW